MANPEHVKWLLEGVEAWNDRRLKERFTPDFRGLSLQMDLLNHDHGHDDQGSLFEGFDLADANLSFADFSWARLSRTDLKGANLWRANFSFATLRLADLTGASLVGADLSDAVLWDVDLQNANLNGTVLTGADFRNANLAEANLRDSPLVGADFSGAEPWLAQIFADQLDTLTPLGGDPWLIENIEDLLKNIRLINDHHNRNGEEPLVYFRGEPKDSFALRPSVMREGLLSFESQILLSLLTQRPEDFDGVASALGQWVISQHHGLKTRLLDITKNPLVAAFFACEKDQLSDGRLHVFAAPSSLVKAYNSDAVSVVLNFAKLTRFEQALLLGKRDGAVELTEYLSPLASISHIYRGISHGTSYRPSAQADRAIGKYGAAMRRLCQLIREEKPYFEDRIDVKELYQVFVVEPQQSSERLRAQSGAFLVSAFHERFERSEISKWNADIPVYAHYTLLIPSACKVRILADLELLNITRETLFPGLDESAAAITNRYRKKQ